MQKKDALPINITNAGNAGYYVRVRIQGTMYQRHFAWRSFPNKATALRAAIRWRDDIRLVYGTDLHASP